MGIKHATLHGHADEITDCVLNRDGKLILTSSEDDTVRLWSRVNGKCLATYEGHHGAVYGCAFSRDSKLALSASWDKTLKLWDVQAVVKRLVASGCGEGTVRVWDILSGSCVASFRAHSKAVTKLRFAESSVMLATVSEDKTGKLWDMNNLSKPLRLLRGHSEISKYRSKRWGAVLGVDFSYSSKLVVTCATDRTCRIWNSRTGYHVGTLRGHDDDITCVSFSSTGYFICTGSKDGTLKVWFLTKRVAKPAGCCITPWQILALWPRFSKLYGGWTQYPAQIIRRIAEY
eukprot:g485.t1